MVKNLPAHQLTRVAASGALTSVPTTVYGIQVIPNANQTFVALYNNADGSGTPLFEAFAYVNSGSAFVDLSNLGPVYFSEKCYVKITGADGIAYIFYD